MICEMMCEETNMIFINLSNHPSKFWGEKQRTASLKYGEILDYPFPAVDPRATSEDVNTLADQISEDIVMKSPSVVMCQGEFTLTFAIVHRLQEKGIKVLSACTERHVSEETDESGRTSRKSVFEFVQYREYLY